VLVAYLFRSGEIKLRHRGAYAESENSIDLFIKPSLYEAVTIEQSLVLDTETVTKASEIARKLFTDYPPATLRELADHIRKNLGVWKNAIATYQENVSHDPALYPGVPEMAEILAIIQGLIKQNQDDELITTVGSQAALLLHAADQFKKIDAFYQNQVRIWREAQRTCAKASLVAGQFDSVPEFGEAYRSICTILADKNPYDRIKDLGPAIASLDHIQEKALVESRKKVQAKVAELRETVTPICAELSLSPEETYKVKTRLNHLYEQAAKEANLAQLEIMMTQGSQAAYNDAVTVLQSFRQTPKQDNTSDPIRERPTENVRLTGLTDMKTLSSTAEVDRFVEQLRNKLKQKIAEGKLIKIE